MAGDSRTSKRNTLPHWAKSLRNELYRRAPGIPYYRPRYEEKLTMFELIKTLPKTEWYTFQRHLTWCSGRESSQRNHHTMTNNNNNNNNNNHHHHHHHSVITSTPSPSPGPEDGELVVVYESVRYALQIVPNPSLPTLRVWARELNVPFGLVVEMTEGLQAQAEGA